MHGDVHGNVFRSSFQFDQNTDAVHVHVATDSFAITSTRCHSSDLDILSDLGNHGLSSLFQGRSVDFLAHQCLDAVAVNLGGSRCDLVAVRQETGILSDEISFAVNFHHDSLASCSGNSNLSFGGHAAGLLVGRGKTLRSKVVGSSGLVSIAFKKSLFAVHHTSSSVITKLLDGFGGDFSTSSSRLSGCSFGGGCGCGRCLCDRGRSRCCSLGATTFSLGRGLSSGLFLSLLGDSGGFFGSYLAN
mmetsp:Transcript_32092/g.91552  ORF Transcript_32092/g.91552 Transcript_32092/m.91552 type:complete len:245 (+) Transcript_32092:400-1134(+)